MSQAVISPAGVTPGSGRAGAGGRATPVHLHGCVVINTESGSARGGGVRCATHKVNANLILFSAIGFVQVTNGECK